MSSQGVMRHELICHLERQIVLETAGHVDPGQFSSFGLGPGRQLLALARQIGALRISLGADRDILSRGHGKRARYTAGESTHKTPPPARSGGSHADDQAAGGDKAVVGTEHRGTKPTDSLAAVELTRHDRPLAPSTAARSQ